MTGDPNPEVTIVSDAKADPPAPMPVSPVDRSRKLLALHEGRAMVARGVQFILLAGNYGETPDADALELLAIVERWRT